MNKNKKWLLVVSIATMVTANGIAMAATPVQQDATNGKKPAFASSKGDFMKKGHIRGEREQENRTALLALLKIDAETLKSERMSGKSLLVIAKEHGVSEKALTDFFVKQMNQRIEEGMKAGRISKEKQVELKDNIATRVKEIINRQGNKQGHMKDRKQGHKKIDNSELLALLKIDAQTLRNEFKQGKSLISIATEHGVSEQQLKDFYKNMVSKRIDTALESGRISKEKAETMKAKAMERMEKFLTKSPARGK